MNWLGGLVQKLVTESDTVLDLGCGIMTAIDGLKYKSYLGVDVWMPYLEHIKHKQNVLQMDVTENLEQFLDDSYDVVLCLDLLEHLELKQADYVLSHLNRICRKKSIIFTPSKFDTNIEATKNAWDLGECSFQTHKCLIPRELLYKKQYSIRTDNTDGGYFGVFNKNGNHV